MTSQSNSDFQIELDALHGRLAALESARTARHQSPPRPRRSRRQRLIVALTMALLLLSVPLGLAASYSFTDVPVGHPYRGDIVQVASRGIMGPCNAQGDRFCPDTPVTRAHLAGALARTGGFGDYPPVVNAKTAQTATTATTAQNAQHAQTATTAQNAQKLQGYEADDLVRAAGKAETGESNVNSYWASGEYDNKVEAAIGAPTRGYVLVFGSVVTGHDGTAVAARVRHVGTGATSPLVRTYDRGDDQISTLSLTHLFPVNQGTHTFVLDVTKYNGDEADVAERMLTLLFVPFGAAGDIPITFPGAP